MGSETSERRRRAGGSAFAGDDLPQIRAQLAARAEALASELLPAGRRRGAEWVEASTARGGLGDSLSVRISGPRAGVWAHFAAGEAGDALDLIAYLRTGGNRSEALRWARHWLGMGNDRAGPLLARRRAEAERRAIAARAAAAAAAEQRARAARAMWLAGSPPQLGDAVDLYLSSRGIGLAALGRQPGFLRVADSLPHHESGTSHPAMLACIVGGDGQHIATHRTWLTADGRKAPVTPVKMVLGASLGGHVPVWKGAHRVPLRRLPAGVPVYVTEGIEDALSVAMLLPEARVIAAVSLAGMAAVALPETVDTVVLVAQNDPETLPDGRPHPAVAGLQRAIRAHAAAGRTVRVARSPPGIKDFNDWLRS